MGGLQQQRAELDAALAEVRREMKSARQKKKDMAKAEAKVCKLSKFLMDASLIIYTLTGYELEPVITFLAANGRKRQWTEETDEELEILAEDIFLKADVAELAELTDMEAPADLGAMQAAMTYVKQWAVVDWTRRQNSQHGVAPCTEFVLQEFEAQRASVPELVRPPAAGVASESSARVWASAW